MKTLKLFTVLVLLVSVHASADAEQSIQDLNKAKSAVLTLPSMETVRYNDGDANDKALKKAYTVLDKAVAAMKESKDDQTLMDDIVSLSAEMIKKDPSGDAVWSILDLYKDKKLKPSFTKAVSKLPAKERSFFMKVLEGKLREDSGAGNG
ncbi:hypothetical protein [Bdellovibrio sp. HCB209]|uniref:hypothetical protein n=1 Tax=Bdellovibrio sp. HCB209 TaxID=3394354 RepID=UPI0039B42BD3